VFTNIVFCSDFSPHADRALGASQVISWKSKDGWPVEGVLLTPPGYAPGQKVPLVGITVTNSPTLTFAKGGAKASLKWRDDFVAWTKHVTPSVALSNSPLVFVGYGVEAPEFGWDQTSTRLSLDVSSSQTPALLSLPDGSMLALWTDARGFGDFHLLAKSGATLTPQ